MPITLDFPRKDDRELGKVLHNAVEIAKRTDMLKVATQASAVHAYVEGGRSFSINSPSNPHDILLQVDLPPDEPMHEAIVSEVNTEIGEQQRIDISPGTKPGDLTLQGMRDKAVALGTLSYLFPERVYGPPNNAFQKMRVEEGCAGLAVMPTRYPGVGWGLKVVAIPFDELVFLPVGVSRRIDVKAIVWRKWVTVDWLRMFLKSMQIQSGGNIGGVPREGTDAWRRLKVETLPYGYTVATGPGGAAIGQTTRYLDDSFSDRNTLGDSRRSTRRGTMFTELKQVFITDDLQHMDRRIFMAGEHIFENIDYSETERRQLPISWGVFAAVGGPYGRSMAFPKMMANIRDERILTALSRHARDVDAYGMVMFSSNMGVNLNEVYQQFPGFKGVIYNTDQAHPANQPNQLSPVNLDRVFGRTPGYIQAMGKTIFPDTPLAQGRAPGRVDSNAAITQLDELSQTSIKNGAESARAAWIQIYRAGLELAAEHYREGDKIPITMVTPDLAGVVVDVEGVPKSEDEIEADQALKLEQARGFTDRGLDPSLALSLLEVQKRQQGPDLAPNPGEDSIVPVPRFTVGPNTIPHPNRVQIDIRSMIPRDREKEFVEIQEAIQMGFVSPMEAQIRIYSTGVDRWVGGEANWNTYQVAVLNLLSAFGNGVESGPILLNPGSFVPRTAYWVISTFMSSLAYSLASKTVQNKIVELQNEYNPINAPGVQLTADEAAAMQRMDELAQMRGRSAGGLPPPPQTGATGNPQVLAGQLAGAA